MARRTKKYRGVRRRLAAIDLFAGCGGLTVGLKQAGFRVLAAVEIDQDAAITYRQNHSDVLVKNVDIRILTPRALRRELNMRRGALDLLAGCPPCQGFSKLRTQNRSRVNKDRRNDLVSEMLHFVQEFMPKAVMMENVPELARFESFKRLCRGLRDLGYSFKWQIKNAAKYGVPQRRRRLILIAGRTTELDFGKERAFSRTVRSTIGRLSRPGKSRDALHNMLEKRSPKIARLIRDIPKNGGSRTDLPKSRQLKCHQKQSGFNDIYGRMSWDEVAPTITTGCFNPSKGRFLHPTQNRAITMREAALLQGFPKSYIFDPGIGKQNIALMIGNALPPEFIRRNALKIREALTKNG